MGLWFPEPLFDQMSLAALKRERIKWNVVAYDPSTSDRERNLAYQYTCVLDEWIEKRLNCRVFNDSHWNRRQRKARREVVKVPYAGAPA